MAARAPRCAVALQGDLEPERNAEMGQHEVMAMAIIAPAAMSGQLSRQRTASRSQAVRLEASIVCSSLVTLEEFRLSVVRSQSYRYYFILPRHPLSPPGGSARSGKDW